MTLLQPGSLGGRTRRASGLVFGWRAADRQLAAYTGQPATFTEAAIPGPITGVNGQSAGTAPKGLPRFTASADGVMRLRLQAFAAITYDEMVTYPFALGVQPLTLYVVLRSLFTLGTAGAAGPIGNLVLSIGTSTAGGGMLYLSRIGSTWAATRQKGATAKVVASPAETGAWVHPFTLLATMSATGVVSLTVRDGSGVIRHSGSATADATLAAPADLWSNGTLALSGVANNGANFDYDTIKIARGVLTMAEIEGRG